MAEETLPYMQSTGLVTKILDKIKEAKTPDRFSQDYLGTVLGYASGSAKPFVSLGKRIGLINSDGTPSELYRRFRGSQDESRAAMAAAIRIGYAPLYRRNEHAHALKRDKLEGLIKEITGAESGSSTVRAIVGTFESLKAFADFDLDSSSIIEQHQDDSGSGGGGDAGDGNVDLKNEHQSDDKAPVRFGYTININLPNTNDITVFNAIFKSLKEHLL